MNVVDGGRSLFGVMAADEANFASFLCNAEASRYLRACGRLAARVLRGWSPTRRESVSRCKYKPKCLLHGGGKVRWALGARMPKWGLLVLVARFTGLGAVESADWIVLAFCGIASCSARAATSRCPLRVSDGVINRGVIWAMGPGVRTRWLALARLWDMRSVSCGDGVAV